MVNMELLLIVQEQVTEFVPDRAILPDWGMMRIDADDGMPLVAIKEAREVAFKRINEDPRALCLGDPGYRNRSLGDLVLREKRLYHRLDLSSSYRHSDSPL